MNENELVVFIIKFLVIMKVFSCVLLLFFLALGHCKDCPGKRINSKLICYYSKLTDVDSCYCTHVVLPANSDLKSIESLKQKLTGAKILLTVTEFNQVVAYISYVDACMYNLALWKYMIYEFTYHINI